MTLESGCVLHELAPDVTPRLRVAVTSMAAAAAAAAAAQVQAWYGCGVEG
jgi:hypothetical protein